MFALSLPISVSWPPGILPWNEHMTAVRVFRVSVPTHTGTVVQPPYVTERRLPSPACFRKENTKSAVKYLWRAWKVLLCCLPCFPAAYSLATVLQSLMWDLFFLAVQLTVSLEPSVVLCVDWVYQQIMVYMPKGPCGSQQWPSFFHALLKQRSVASSSEECCSDNPRMQILELHVEKGWGQIVS